MDGSRRGGGGDASEAKHKARCAIADDFGIAVEQFDLGVPCPGRGDAEPADSLQPQMLGDVRGAEGAAQALAGKPFLASPLTM